MGDIYVRTAFAEKLWFHGRMEQKLGRLFCRIFGHPWSKWRWEWDEENMVQDEAYPDLSPPPYVTLLWIRRCERGCGALQTCQAKYTERSALPWQTPTRISPKRRSTRNTS